MREQIIAALHASAATRLLASALVGDQGHRDFMMGQIADVILEHLATVPQDTPAPTIEILPATTPVATFDPAQVVAALASAAIRQDDVEHTANTMGSAYDENDPYDEPEFDAPIQDHIGHEFMAAGADRREFRQFLFALQKQFGVRVRSTNRIGNESPMFVIAGRENARRGFLLLAQTFHDLGSDPTATMTADERASFWATVGTLVNNSPRAEAQIEANQDRAQAATAYLNRTFGRTRNLNRTQAAEPGTDTYDNAVSVLQAAANMDAVV